MVGSSELGGTENQDLYLHYQIEKGKDGAAPMKALWCGRLTLDEAKHILNENGGNAEKIKDGDTCEKHEECESGNCDGTDSKVCMAGAEKCKDYRDCGEGQVCTVAENDGTSIVCGAQRKEDQACRTDDEDLMHQDCNLPLSGSNSDEASDIVCRDGKCQKVQCQVSADCPKKSSCNVAAVAKLFAEEGEAEPNYCEVTKKAGSKCMNDDNCENDLICVSESGDELEEICTHRGKTGETCKADEGESTCETGLMCTENVCAER